MMRSDKRRNTDKYKLQIVTSLFDGPKTKKKIFLQNYPEVLKLDKKKFTNKYIAWLTPASDAFEELIDSGVISEIDISIDDKNTIKEKYNVFPESGLEKVFYIFEYKKYFTNFFLQNFVTMKRNASLNLVLLDKNIFDLALLIPFQNNPLSIVLRENSFNYIFLKQVLQYAYIKSKDKYAKAKIVIVQEEIDNLVKKKIDKWYEFEKKRNIVYRKESQLKSIKKVCLEFMEKISVKLYFSKKYIELLDNYYGNLLIPPRQYFSSDSKFGSVRRPKTVISFSEYITYSKPTGLLPVNLFRMSNDEPISRILL